jgi:hypothetical protein
LARGEGDELGERLKAARRVSVPPAAISAMLVCALFRGTADGRARSSLLVSLAISAPIAQAPETSHDDRAARREDGHDLRAAAAAS